MVEQHRGTIMMDELRVGDYVATAAGSFSRVFSLAHLHREVESDFLQIYTDPSAILPLEVTSDHLLFVNGKAQPASTVRPGDSLSSGNVVRIESIKRRGIYAPLTDAGELLVSGVRVSSYVQVMEGGTVANQHVLGHLLFSPVRLLCHAWPSYCAAETHDTAGYSRLYAWLLHVTTWIGRSGLPWVSYLTTAIVAPLFFPLFVLEQTYVQSNPVVGLLLAAVVSGAALRKGYNQKNSSKKP